MPPAAQLAALLLAARDEHQPFPEAWAASMSRLCWPTDDKVRVEWVRALTFAQHEFQDAYENPHAPAPLARLSLPASEQDLESQIIRMARAHVAV